MTRDDPQTVYDEYVDLVATACLLCADPRDGEQIVVATLARLGAKPRLAYRSKIDGRARRRLVRACISHDRRQRRDARGRPSDVAVMQVVRDLGPTQRGPEDLVRAAVSELPPRQRAALVLRYLDETRPETADESPAGRDTRVAQLTGGSPERVGRDAYAGLAAVAATLGTDDAGAIVGDGSSRTEVMVRRALDAATPPSLRRGDCLLAVDRTTRSINRRRTLLAAAAAVVLTVIGVQVLTGGSDSVVTPVSRAAAAIPPAPPQTLYRQPTAYPSAVVDGGGYLWTVELHPSGKRSGTSVERRSLATGRVERTYHVPGEDFGIGFGLGRVWTWGAAARRTLTADISVINPSTAAVHTVTVGTGQISDVAFTSGRAWFAQAAHNRVIALSARLGRSSYVANGASQVAAYGRGSVVVLGSAGDLTELPVEVGINHNDTTLTYLSGTPQYGVWLAHGRVATYSPSIDLPLIVSLRLPLEVSHVVGTPQTGVYVATASRDPLHYDPYLLYYSPIAMQATHPRPTAKLGGAVQVASMTADSRGGIVYVATDGTVVRWDPTSSTQVITGSESLAGTMR